MAATYNLQDSDGEFILRVTGDGEFITSSSVDHAARFAASDANRIIKSASADGVNLTRILVDMGKAELKSERVLPILRSWGWNSESKLSDDTRVDREFRFRNSDMAAWKSLAGSLFAEMANAMGEEYRDLAGHLWSATGDFVREGIAERATPGQRLRFINMVFRNNSRWGSEHFARFMNSRIDGGITGTKDTYGEDARRQAEDPTDDRPTGKEFSEGGISVDEKVKSSGSDSQNVSVADRIADRYAEDPLMDLLRKSIQADQWAAFEFLLSLPNGPREEIVKGKPSWLPLRSELFDIVKFIIEDDKPKPSLSGAMKAILGDKEWNPSREKKVRKDLQAIFIRAFGDGDDMVFADPKDPKAPFVATASLSHAGFRVTSSWKSGSPEFMKAGK